VLNKIAKTNLYKSSLLNFVYSLGLEKPAKNLASGVRKKKFFFFSENSRFA